MDIKRASQQFALRRWRSATVLCMSDDAYALVFDGVDGQRQILTLARSEEPKVFRSADGALADARRIGFKEVKVFFGDGVE